MTVKTKNFNPDVDKRLKCSHCGAYHIKQSALDKLQLVREDAGRPLSLTSGYRCAQHPNEVNKSKPGQHNKGVAFDIKVSNGIERRQIAALGIKHGASVGVANTFVHLDWRDGTPVMWVY